jgi:hypothetical protein
MNTGESMECCPRFEPAPWDDKVITWERKLFLQDRVVSFLRIPLNFGAVMKRSMATIEAAGALPDQRVILSDENSLWGADVYELRCHPGSDLRVAGPHSSARLSVVADPRISPKHNGGRRIRVVRHPRA